MRDDLERHTLITTNSAIHFASIFWSITWRTWLIALPAKAIGIALSLLNAEYFSSALFVQAKLSIVCTAIAVSFWLIPMVGGVLRRLFLRPGIGIAEEQWSRAYRLLAIFFIALAALNLLSIAVLPVQYWVVFSTFAPLPMQLLLVGYVSYVVLKDSRL